MTFPVQKNSIERLLALNWPMNLASHFAQVAAGTSFVCLERKGSENYPSLDKAVLFFEVPDLAATVELLGPDRILRYEPAAKSGRASWAVLHDTEGHNILLLHAPNRKSRKRH